MITAPVVQRQHDGFSCGYYAVANMTSIILDPSSDLRLQFYDQNELIPHVKSILIDSNPVSAFPPIGRWLWRESLSESGPEGNQGGAVSEL